MAYSRNRATQGRATKSPIDVYMQKGQIVARTMPQSRVDFPSEAQERNKASVMREREIEKQLDLGDVMALKWRAVQSRYNWWEILGKIYISREFNDPGSVCAISKVWFKKYSRDWMVYLTADRYATYEILDFGTPAEYAANHYWRYATHREAGLENTLRGIEVLKYKKIPIRNQYWHIAPQQTTLWIYKALAPVGHIVMIRAWCAGLRYIIGETGLIYWTATDPWWLDAPFPFMP